MMTVLIALYLAAAISANLLVARFGPWALVVTAFFMIGLNITVRDALHEEWHGKGLVWKMALLIATGSVLSYAINHAAANVAIASFIAFAAAESVDALVYQLLYSRRWMLKVNASNAASATTDSIVFPTVAFGEFLPLIVLSQILIKFAGGFMWSLLLNKRKAPHAARI